MSPNPPPPRSTRAARTFRWKAVSLAAVVLLLMLGLGLTGGVLQERKFRQSEAVAEIEAAWGGPQRIVGPILRVPVRREHRQEVVRSVDGQREVVPITKSVSGVVWVLPERFDAEMESRTETRYRGIYEATVYRAEVTIAARFAPRPADFAAWDEVNWSEAEVWFSVSEPRSLPARPRASIGGEQVSVQPAEALAGWEGGMAFRAAEAAAVLQQDGGAEVTLQLSLLGSRRWEVVPVGESSVIAVEGDWAHPSFHGPPLPLERSVSEEGFTARWETTALAREVPRQGAVIEGDGFPMRELQASALGVTLLTPVDAYRMVERSLKYGILFIAVVFTTFLLFEVRGEQAFHPVQYLLVGASLVLFFLAFLALTEVLGPLGGYLVAVAVVLAMVTAYVRALLRADGQAWGLGAGMAFGYGYLYFVLQSESLALLAGVIALTTLLGAVMWLTREVDWDVFMTGGRQDAAVNGGSETPGSSGAR